MKEMGDKADVCAQKQDEEAWQLIVEIQEAPLPLQNLCRVRIREEIRKGNMAVTDFEEMVGPVVSE